MAAARSCFLAGARRARRGKRLVLRTAGALAGSSPAAATRGGGSASCRLTVERETSPRPKRRRRLRGESSRRQGNLSMHPAGASFAIGRLRDRAMRRGIIGLIRNRDRISGRPDTRRARHSRCRARHDRDNAGAGGTLPPKTGVAARDGHVDGCDPHRRAHRRCARSGPRGGGRLPRPRRLHYVRQRR